MDMFLEKSGAGFLKEPAESTWGGSLRGVRGESLELHGGPPPESGVLFRLVLKFAMDCDHIEDQGSKCHAGFRSCFQKHLQKGFQRQFRHCAQVYSQGL